MKHLITTILTILLINVCIAKDKESKKESIPFSYEDYISYYGINDTSIAIIDVFFDNQNRFGVGQLSYLPTAAAISPALTSLISSRVFACIWSKRPMRSRLPLTGLYTLSPLLRTPE